MQAGVTGQKGEDPVSNVLKWILLAVAIITFAVLGWTTVLTYKTAPPFPDRFVTEDGTILMSAADIQAGKAGFQKADLMDYGSLFGIHLGCFVLATTGIIATLRTAFGG